MKTSVCIAMDHQLHREEICGILSTSGFEVSYATDSRSNLLKILQGKTTSPRYCLMDFRLPGVGSDIICQQLKDAYPAMLIIVYSMDINPETISRMNKAGCEQYLLKGCDVDELIKALTS